MRFLYRITIAALTFFAGIFVASPINALATTAQTMPTAPPCVAVVYCVCGANNDTAAQNAPIAASNFAQQLTSTFHVQTSISEASGSPSEERIQKIADDEHATVVIYYEPDWIAHPYGRNDTLSVTVSFPLSKSKQKQLR